MSWTVTGTEKTPVDTFGIANVGLLLHANSSPITDSSPAARSLTVTGDAAIDTSTKKFGAGSIKYDGTGDTVYCTLPAVQDYTIECWFNANSVSSTLVIFGLAVDSVINVAVIATGLLRVRYGTSGATTTAISANTWYHLAVARQGSSTKAFLDGVDFTGSLSQDAGPMPSHTFGIGSNGSSAITPFNGFIDEVRVTLGIARYTSNFTPPTAPFPDI